MSIGASRQSILRMAAAAFSVAAAVSFVPPRADAALLTCSIVDAADGTPLPSRCRVIDLYGNNRYPPILRSFYHPAAGGYFYADGSFTVSVPAGNTIVRAGHGFEYGERIDTIVVAADTAIVLELERKVDMRALGWVAGDTHVHIHHEGGYFALEPADALLMGRAEGLGVVNCLDNEYRFTGAPDPCSLPECIVFMSEEERSASYGHMGFLGLTSLVQPVTSLWWPLGMDLADSCHARPGALVVAAHPVTTAAFDQVEAWPGSGLARELPADVLAGKIDALDVMSYSNAAGDGLELDLWYRLLNCGFRLPASAGTDAAVNRLDSPPPGGYRVYARPDPAAGSPYEGWLRGIAAGRSFVTNGPLIASFSLDDFEPGDGANLGAGGASIFGQISIRGCYAVDRIDVVVNGRSARSIVLDPPRSTVDTSFVVGIEEGSWVAARVMGPKGGWLPAGTWMWAHTSPIYFTVAGKAPADTASAAWLARWMAAFEDLAREKGSFPSEADEARVFDELASARAFFEAMANGGITEAESPSAPGISVSNVPNPFGAETTIDFRLGLDLHESARFPVRVAVYDVSGRLVRELSGARAGPATWRAVWDGRTGGGVPAPSGVYFARLESRGRALVRKIVLVR